jgi:hypothetical protein
MNIKRLWAALAITVSITAIGCNKSGKLNEPSTSPAPTGPVELKLKWTVGEKILQSMDMKMKNEMNMPNQTEPMKQDMEIGQDYGMTVMAAQPDGGHEVELEFMAARMKMTMGGKEMMNYDSAKKSSSDTPNPAADMFGKIVGAKICYFLDATNSVQKIEGMDEMLNRMSGGDAAAAAPLKNMFNEGSFKQLMSQALFLPAKAVQPGDTWPVKIEMPMGQLGTLSMNYNVTFQKWETHGSRNCARLDYDGTLSSKQSPPSKSEPVSISDLQGTLTGTSWFDPELGTMIDNTLKQDMTMVMTMSMGGQKEMTNHMIQDVNIKMTSLK